jgi:hypothetical protein
VLKNVKKINQNISVKYLLTIFRTIVKSICFYYISGIEIEIIIYLYLIIKILYIMSEFKSIQFRCKQFVIRTITIFVGTNKEETINVGSTALLNYLIDTEESEDLLNPDYLSLDNHIQCYVEPMQLLKMSDETLIKYVEQNYFQ